MGNRRRPRNQTIKPVRSSRPMPEPGPGEAWCTQIAVIPDRHVEEDVEEARQGSHDTLIDGLGTLRRSGVFWTEYPAALARRALDDFLPEDGTDLVRDTRTQVLEMLQAPESLLVVAWALGVMPEGETFADGGRP